MKTNMNHTKKILGMVAVTLLVAAMAIVGAGAAYNFNNAGSSGESHTFFNYQYVYNNDVLTAGNYATKDSSSHFFTVPKITSHTNYYIPGNLPAGLYYLNGDNKNPPIYISPISTSYISDSFGTKVIGDEVIVTTENSAELTPVYLIKRDGEGAFLKMFPSEQVLWDGKLINKFPKIFDSYLANTKDIGTWKVYVTYLHGLENYLSSVNNITNISANSILERFSAFYSNAPDNARYLEIGTLNIVSSIDHKTTVTISSKTDTKNDDGKAGNTPKTEIVEPIKPPVEVTVSISGASLLNVGDTVLFTAKNSDGSSAKFKWNSSDPSVASVDENGNIKGLMEGTVTISVTNTETGMTASKTVTVVREITTDTPKSPGFGIIAALTGLGAVAVLNLRRK